MDHSFHSNRSAAFLTLVAISASVLVGVAVYTAAVPNDPPGFYIDESSIAYNAHTIAQTGRDEYGVPWPLYFRAFGEYKNPIYIYALAALFKITGPSIHVARLFSALLGAAACLLLGCLAWRLSRDVSISIIVLLSAVLTPWLYQSSRLVFEVAAYPLVTVLFLLALQRAAARRSWNLFDVLKLAVCLALITYTYSIGRLLAPLFAMGLVLFAHKGNRRAVALTLAAYALTLLPLAIFATRNPGALTSRMSGITYLSSQSSPMAMVPQFLRHYAAAVNPVAMIATGENNVRDHVPGAGSLLVVTFILAVAGLVIVMCGRRKDAWWRFILYALVVSIIPAALTVNYFPQLRLVTVPVLLHVLMVPALQTIKGVGGGHASTFSLRRITLVACLLFIALQGAYFQFLFHRYAPSRWYFMDARFQRKVLEPALQFNRRPIYLYDPPGQSGYIQALWYGAIRGGNASDFVRLSSGAAPPADSVVISTERTCANCRLIARSLNYIVYASLPTNAVPNVSSLPSEAFRGRLALRQTPTRMVAGQKQKLRVSVQNISKSSWSCISDAEGNYAVVVRARWRKSDDTVIPDAARSELNYDLEPGDVNDLDLAVTPPAAAADYILEIDLVQEPDKWFSQNGSEMLRVPIAVKTPE